MKLMISFVLLLASTSAFAQDRNLASEEVRAIRSVEPSLPNEELTPMMQNVFQGTGILGIGESVHGSRQMLKMQHRLIQNAIQTQGVRYIFWESNLFRTKDINEYLATCKGDLPRAIESAHSWAFQEDVDLFDWICKFNQTQKANQVQIIGVDIYNFAELNHQWVIDKTAGSKNGEKIRALLHQTTDICIGHGKSHDEYMTEIFAYYYKEAQISPINFELCNSNLTAVLKLLETNDRAAGQITDLEAVEMRVYVRNLLASQWYWLNRFALGDSLIGAWKPRDSAMAANVIDFWNTLGKPKSIFLAHTSHVAKSSAAFIQSSPELSFDKTEHIYPAGTYIQNALGSRYKVIGFTGYDIDGPQGDFITPTSNESLDLFIQKFIRSPVVWIDLSKGSKNFDRYWWLQHENGGKGAFNDGVWMNPTDHYDALIYIERSEASKPIDTKANPTVFEQLQKTVPTTAPFIEGK